MRFVKNIKLCQFLFLILSLVVFLIGCTGQPTNPSTEKTSKPFDDYDNSKIFRDLSVSLEDNEIKSISIVRIDDMIKNDQDRERQVYQEIMEELTKVVDLKVIEGDHNDIDRFFKEKNIDPARGLSTDSSINLSVYLNVDAVIYGTIESDDIDVNLKVYSAEDGGVLFSKTLSRLKLPMSKSSNKFEIPPELLESVPDSE